MTLPVSRSQKINTALHAGSASPGFQERSRSKRVTPARAQEHNHQALLQVLAASPIGLWDWNLADGLTWSRNTETIFGLAPGVFAQTLEAFLNAVYAEDREPVRASLRAALASEADFHQIFRVSQPDGTLRWVEGQGQIVRDAQGQAIGMTGICIDITARKDAEAKVGERERQLQAVTDIIPVLIARIDTECRYVFANRAYQDRLGIPLEQVIGRSMPDVIGEDAFNTIQPHVERVLAGEPADYEALVNYRTIGPKYIHATYVPEHGAEGNVTGFVLCAIDITARRQAEDATRRLAMIVENSHEAIISTGLDGTVLSWNRGAERLYGYTAEEAVGQSIRMVFPPEAIDEVPRLLTALEENTDVMEYEAVRIRKDGVRRTVSVTLSPFQDSDGRLIGHSSIVRDVSARKILEEEREHLLTEMTERADHDPLTGLLNHRAFYHRLEEEADRSLREGTSLVVAMLDLDNFKFFNDAYGHPAGDDALREVATALRRNCRPGETLARFGGDEFAMLIPKGSPETTETLTARFAEKLSAISFSPPGCIEKIPLSLSVGMARYPEECPTRVEAVALADRRLYDAKSGMSDEGEAELLRATMSTSVEGFSMLDALVTAVDNKDRYTRHHSEDVLIYSLDVARGLGLDDKTQHTVAVAALLHDLGKIGVPDAVLRKPGQLLDAEFAAVKQHPMMGAVIVGAVPGFEETLDAIRHHHERWDGEGYPFGLKGEEIPPLARLLAVADAYSAMTTDRPYRKGMTSERALTILREGAGTQWAPECVAAFLSARRH